MPYATPSASPVSPVSHVFEPQASSHTQAQGQGHAQPPVGGRPGHRRSYTHSHISLPSSNSNAGSSFASTSSSLGSLPRRRSASHSGAQQHVQPPTPTQATPRKPTFQLGNADDDDSNESNEEDVSPLPPSLSVIIPTIKHTPSPSPSVSYKAPETHDEEDTRRGLPPLRLKVKTASFSELDGLPQVPFPRSSPRNSPRGSPLHSPSGGVQGISAAIPTVGAGASSSASAIGGRTHLHPQHVRSTSEQTLPVAAGAGGSPPGSAAAANAKLIRPQVARTISSPVLFLSNGKPLRSSLKSSSSSPNIPFPSQSLVPSIMWPDLHKPHQQQHHHHQRHHHLGHGLAHERAASAPSTPHLESAAFSHPPPLPSSISPPAPGSIARSISHPPLPSSRAGSGGSVTFPSLATSPTSPSDNDPTAPPPSLTSSISSIYSSASASNSGSSETSPSSSPPQSPSSVHSTYTYPPHPHPPKNVHFPSQDNNLATVRVFNRSARPASLSTPRMGEETETETEGEGSSTGGNGGLGGFGVRWGVQWGSVGYPFPRVGSGSGPLGATTTTVAGQGSLPRRNRSPLRVGSTSKSLDADNDDESANEDLSSSSSKNVIQNQKEKEMQEVYALNTVQSSFIPMRADDMDGDLRYGAGNGHVVGEGNVYFESVGFVRAKSEGAYASSSSATTPPPLRPLTLTGTLLVRNITYAKTVAVRFTMDDWHTTNDVLASYECSLPGGCLPQDFGRAREKVKDASSLDVGGGVNATAGSGPRRNEAPGQKQKGWDRFRFTINLEDYAASGTLEERTMWLVGRYTAGVDVRERAASLSSSSSASSLSSLSGATPNTTSSSTTGTDGTNTDSEAMLNDLALPPSAQEWWDNNAGRNYKISFRKVFVPVVRPASQVAVGDSSSTAASSTSAVGLVSDSTNTKMVKDVVKSDGGVYRRGMIVSAPSSYSYTPPISTYTHSPTEGSKSYPAPPQISSSVTFPGSGSFQTMGTGLLSPNSGMTEQQREQHRQHQAALTQSTLARLKKLNLRNYAAPKPAIPSTSLPTAAAPQLHTSSSPEPTLTPTYTPMPTFNTTSRDSTPVQTPRDDFHVPLPPQSLSEDLPQRREAEVHDEDRTLTFQGAVAPSWGGGGMSMENGFPATMMTRGMNVMPSNPVELGSSPPFSMMGGVDLDMAMMGMKSGKGAAGAGGPGASAPGTSVHWPWGSFGDDRIQGNNQNQSQNHLQDQDRAREENGSGAEDSAKAKMLMDIKARSTSPVSPVHTSVPTLSSASALGQMAVPHRRRKESSFHIGGGAAARSSASGSGSGSPSGSPSGSGSDSAKASSAAGRRYNQTGNGNGSGLAMWNGINRPGSPILRTPSGLGSSALPSSSSPFRVSPVPSPLSSSSSSPPMSSSTSPASPSATPDDAVYQAFVRQWCFAQAPGPTVGGSGVGVNGANAATGGGSGRGSPGTASPGPGSLRTTGEFAEGPRLIVG